MRKRIIFQYACIVMALVLLISCDQLQSLLQLTGDKEWEWSGPTEITGFATPYTYELSRDSSDPRVQSARWELVSSTSAVVKNGNVSNPTDKSIRFTVDYSGLSNGTYTLKVYITYTDGKMEIKEYLIRINVNTTGGSTGGDTGGDTGGGTSYLYEETFDTVTITTNMGASYWYKPSGCTGIVMVVNDPTGAGKGKVLELKDTITSTGDMGAIVYSPVIDALKNENIVGKTLELDFYFASDVSGRWFLLAKTHQQAFIMHDPNGSVNAYASLVHNKIPVPLNTWLKLKVEFQSGSYNVYVYNGATLVGQILNKPNNPETYDGYEAFLNSTTAGNGRLFFGSWFSYPGCEDYSHGHTYIDNIRVY